MTIAAATAMQMSQSRTLMVVVSSRAASGPNTVARMSGRIDAPVAITNVLSANLSRLNIVRRSSLVAIEKNNAYSENVTTPIVCAAAAS